jgi:mono/diheme cytochrome c family protein
MVCGRSFIACLLAALVACATGCGKSEPTAPSGPEGLFQMHCAGCHAQAGEPGGPGVGSSKGPKLTKIGAEPGRTADYLADYIRDPTSKDPNARMPKFEGKLKPEEIRALAEYLAARKS